MKAAAPAAKAAPKAAAPKAAAPAAAKAKGGPAAKGGAAPKSKGKKGEAVDNVVETVEDKDDVQKILVLKPKNIVEMAMSTGKHKTFVAALKKTGLLELLSSKHNLTVYAPNDEAFMKLVERKGPETVWSLKFRPDLWAQAQMQLLMMPDLKEILLHHVVDGNWAAKPAEDGLEEFLTTAGQTKLRFHRGVQRKAMQAVNLRFMMVDNAQILKQVPCANGNIVIIDEVLLPA